METKAPVIFPEFAPEGFENKFLDITAEEYHAYRTAVHSGSLIKVIKSPFSYLHHVTNPKVPTKAMKFGSIAHEAMLEGTKFLNRYVVEPMFSGYTKTGEFTTSANATSVKAAKAEWYAELAPGTLVVTQEELDKLRWMMDSILSHPIAIALLKDGRPEVKGQWKDPVTGLQCVMMNDFLPNNLDTMVEFKTTADCSWERFRRSVEDPEMRYDVQTSFYSEGLYQITKKEPKYKVWIATESVAPFETRCHEVHSGYQNSGRIDRIRAMSDIKRSIETKRFPQGQTVLEEAMPTKWFEEKYIAIEAAE